ncbi:aminoglycoside phosphotransferase family protein [Micromonospora sp. B11E3]|uniref:phosphotransferase family protein n=1 Tax=Micromonospora sp. B11E3 TaxID=3153562 RepID=UPI00325D13A5
MDAREDLMERLATRWRLDSLELIGQGLEFTVYRGLARGRRPVVLRLAPRRFDSNANDPGVDTRALLIQEYEITRHLSGLGFPVAEPVGIHLGNDDGSTPGGAAGDLPDVLVSRYVDDDGSALDCHDLGRLLARLHRLPPPPRVLPAATEGLRGAEVIATRLRRRWNEIGRLVADWPAGPDAALLLSRLAGVTGAGLVHLDVRSANIRRAHGRTEALLDWSNALLGDATVEFGRLVEYARYPENELDVAAVRAGYAACAEVPPPDDPALLVCRLDAAVMLALVFLSEAPDPERGLPAAAHARDLADRLAVGVR